MVFEDADVGVITAQGGDPVLVRGQHVFNFGDRKLVERSAQPRRFQDYFLADVGLLAWGEGGRRTGDDFDVPVSAIPVGYVQQRGRILYGVVQTGLPVGTAVLTPLCWPPHPAGGDDRVLVAIVMLPDLGRGLGAPHLTNDCLFSLRFMVMVMPIVADIPGAPATWAMFPKLNVTKLIEHLVSVTAKMLLLK
jgi:hypothetical protein